MPFPARYSCINTRSSVSLKVMGIVLGGKDHSTINHGIKKIQAEIRENESLSNTIDIIKKKINPV